MLGSPTFPDPPPALQQLRPNHHNNQICPTPMRQIGGRLAGMGWSHVGYVRRWCAHHRGEYAGAKRPKTSKLTIGTTSPRSPPSRNSRNGAILTIPRPPDTSGSALRLLPVSCPLLARPMPISRPAACPPCCGKRSFLKDSFFGEQRCSSPPLWLPRTGMEGTDESGRNYELTYVRTYVRT